MAPIRKVSHRQLELLIEFAEANRRVVLGGLGKGPLGQQVATQAWDKAARRLNAIGGGVIKNAENWKRYWHLLKCRTKCKAAVRRSCVGTGGVLNKGIPLSNLEERIVAVIEMEPMEDSKDPEKKVEFVNVNTESDVVIECQEVKLEPSFMEQPSEPPDVSLSPSTEWPTSAGTDPEKRVEFINVNTESDVVIECQEVKLEPSFMEQPSEPPDVSLFPSTESPTSAVPALSKQASVHRAVPVHTAPPPAGASETLNTTHKRPRRKRDENLPGWAYDLEARRIAVEERLVAEVAGLGQTNRGILACLQQLVQLLANQVSNQAP